MRILLTGGSGQLGRTLIRTAPAAAEIIAPPRDDCDLGDAASMAALVARLRPTHIINAAAFTAVDAAESEREVAWRVNAEAPAQLAALAGGVGARLIQVSTDYVFDGTATTPRLPADAVAPINHYGASKLAGEQAVQAAGVPALVVRTSWLYAPEGRNFVTTMLRLMAPEAASQQPLRVVSDQVGCPTSSHSLATWLWAALAQGVTGLHHWCDAGAVSWHGFALEIQRQALACGRLQQAVPVESTTSAAFPTLARRPAYSVLDCALSATAAGVEQRPWQAALSQALTGSAVARQVR